MNNEENGTAETTANGKKAWTKPMLESITVEETALGKTKMWPIEFNPSYGTMIS